ncbi:hypothetical protein [Atlantibacter hermannii]|uniref:hypothetical protein n=1 Tax=Atlantibacter hermannii TaxID=565 RepID=UPI00289FEDB1|nr:hypothetical protein [Atlantibacter hermannii]
MEEMTRETQQAERRAKLVKIDELMQQVEVLTVELIEGYTEEHDGKFSAIHPRMGFSMMRKQLVELRRGFLRAKL